MQRVVDKDGRAIAADTEIETYESEPVDSSDARL
jgi:hypothetical protein